MVKCYFYAYLIILGLLFSSGCGNGPLYTEGPADAGGTNEDSTNRDKFWQGLAEPHDTFEAYVKALKKNQHIRAVSYIYMKNRQNTEPNVIKMMPELSQKIRDEDWQIKIMRAAKEGRFAAIIFTTTEAQDDPSPILLINEDDRWYLHYYEHSGHLRNILDDETDFSQALHLVDWGKRNVRELNNALNQ